MSGPYLAPSPNVADRFEKIGIDPAKISLRDLNALGCPTKAIRAHCVECSGDSVAEARKCTAKACNLWGFRMGRNPFHARSKQGKGKSLNGGAI